MSFIFIFLSLKQPYAQPEIILKNNFSYGYIYYIYIPFLPHILSPVIPPSNIFKVCFVIFAWFDFKI